MAISARIRRQEARVIRFLYPGDGRAKCGAAGRTMSWLYDDLRRAVASGDMTKREMKDVIFNVRHNARMKCGRSYRTNFKRGR